MKRHKTGADELTVGVFGHAAQKHVRNAGAISAASATSRSRKRIRAFLI
jgi:hypothetical protein